MTRDGVVLIRKSGIAPQRRLVLGVGVLGGLVLLGAGCSSAPKLASLAGSIQASADLNPSVSQRPSPLLLRVYELKTAAGFNQADFMALYQSDTATLGADMVSREELDVYKRQESICIKVGLAAAMKGDRAAAETLAISPSISTSGGLWSK